MHDNERQFEQFVDGIKFDDAPDVGHRDRLEQDLLRVLAEQSWHKQQPLKTWRTIMKSKITKFATAAAITVAVILSITLLHQSASPVWAIERSIEALDRFRAVYMEGWESERTWRKDGGLELRLSRSWAVANEDQTMVKKYRTEVDGLLILTTNGQKTWRYDPNTNTVRVENRPYVASECWFGSRLLEQLKDGRDKGLFTRWEVTYGKDPATGRQRAFLKAAWLDSRYNGPRSLWIEFDMESMLPVGLKQWENSNWEGPATLVAEKITYYESFPDELFEFEIPEGATVIER
jgi:hypothetical protein